MKIVTAVVNNPQFIEIQYHTLKKHFKGDYEFIVFNDAKQFPDYLNGGDITIKTQIDTLCATLNIQCISIPNEHHKIRTNASERCADSMNFILQYQKKHPDQYLLLDSDMFLINDFDIHKYDNYNMAVALQSNVAVGIYIWCGIYYFDFTKLSDLEILNWDCCVGGDVGSGTHNWLEKKRVDHPEQMYHIHHHCSMDWDLSNAPEYIMQNTKLLEFLQNDSRNENGKFFCELYDGDFLHYRSGSNWRNEGMDAHHRLTQALKNVLIE